MDREQTLTRRAALQGMASVAAAAMLPGSISAERAQKGAAPWPGDVNANWLGTHQFNDGWRFHRGDAPGAEAEGFDDSSWRTLDVPHDWSIEDLPRTADE